MPMTPAYPVLCVVPGCEQVATFKIAADWSDGTTKELKTYSLCCDEHRDSEFESAKIRQAACPLELGEVLAAPTVILLPSPPR